MTHPTPTVVADKALAERLEKTIFRSHLCALLYDAHHAGQLIPLAECEARVAAAWEAAAKEAEQYAAGIVNPWAKQTIHWAADAIRKAATGAKKGQPHD
jgi:hypothetical protein